MTQQFAQGFNVAMCLQAGRCKGVAKRMRMRLMDTGFFQIAINALTVASRFDWLFLIARKKPSSAAEIFRQLLQNTKQRFWNGNLTMGVLGLRGLNDDFCVAISTRNPSHCPLDRHSSCLNQNRPISIRKSRRYAAPTENQAVDLFSGA